MSLPEEYTCLDNSEHIQWMEIAAEVPENSLNKLSRLVNVKKRNKNGISSSWLGLMAGSKVGMMVVSLAPSPELGDHAPSSAVAVTLSLFCSFSGQALPLVDAHSL